MAEIQASQLDRLVAGKVEPGPLYTDLPLGEKAELTLTPQGVNCSTVGRTGLHDADRGNERRAGDAGRSGRVSAVAGSVPAELAVGLRSNCVADRRASAAVVRRSDDHAADLGHGVPPADFRLAGSHALPRMPATRTTHCSTRFWRSTRNRKCLQQQSNFARMLAGGLQIDPLGWLGQSVCAYMDDGPFWDDLAKVAPDKREEFMEEQGWRMPLAVRAEVSSGLKLTAFLAAVRGFVEQAAPGMLNWESLTYNEQPYVKITPTPRAIGQTEEIRNLAVYYSASGKSFVLSLNEDVLKRAIDREVERGKLAASGEEPRQPGIGWLGSNLALQVDQKVLQVLATLSRTEYQS